MQEALWFPMEHDYRVVCGLDEAGRGPLAGPVVAGAVILGPDFPTHLLNDSKKLSEKQRLEAEMVIKEKALFWAIALATAPEIDRINIPAGFAFGHAARL